jgi:hypothetical protein
MPSLQNVLLCALSQLAISVCVGLPLARRFVSARRLAPALAPIMGWAVFSTLALPIFSFTGFTRPTVIFLCSAAVIGGAAALARSPRKSAAEGGIDVSVWAYGAAALLAAAPALAVWPKRGGGGVVLSGAMFDHSKVAIIDDIVRLGLPPGNPFFAGGGPRLAYYYLWHFNAAIPCTLFGASGWESDIALTWFTAFASLALMMGLSAWLGGRGRAAPLVLLLSLSASLTPLLRLVLPSALLGRALAQKPWPQGWIFQASWVPQHLASASCVVVVVLILSRLASPQSWRLVPLFAVTVAAAFESSTWVGGVVFAAAAVSIGIAMLMFAGNTRARYDLLLKGAVAVVLVAAISFPFLSDQYLAMAARHAGFPVAFRPFEVLGQIVPDGVRRILDLPAYWAVLLVIQFPAIYFAGTWAMAGALTNRGTIPAKKRLVLAFALLARLPTMISAGAACFRASSC